MLDGTPCSMRRHEDLDGPSLHREHQDPTQQDHEKCRDERERSYSDITVPATVVKMKML